MELKAYLAPLRKWWWLIVLATTLATASAYLATLQQPFIYQSRTTLMVGSASENPNPSGNDVYLAERLASTYIELAQRDLVRDATKEALGLTDLPEHSVRLIPNTQLIEISVLDTSPERAHAVASELATQLRLLTPTGSAQETEKRQGFISQQLDELEVTIIETEEEILKKQGELAGLFSARQIADTRNEISALEDKANTLRANYTALLTSTQRGAVNALNIIEPAKVPVEPIGPQKMYTVLLAAAIGLILAAGAAYLIEYLDDTLKDADGIAKQLGLPTLGSIPRMSRRSRGGELEMLGNRQTPVTEAYRVLRTNLRFVALDRPIRTILITSPLPGDGKSLSAANLAVAMAQSGQRVLLIDGDLRRPRLHALFGSHNRAGLTNLLLEERPTLDTIVQKTGVPGLRLLPSGPLPPNPTDLLSSPRMQALLDRLSEHADAIVLDSPPVIGIADAAALSAQVDGVILILDFGDTRVDTARQALARLEQVGARVLGAVLNTVPVQKTEGYYYARGYDAGPGSGRQASGEDMRAPEIATRPGVPPGS